MNNEKVSGIYKIINKVNGKYYVGSSLNILYGKNNRKYHHFHPLKVNRHYNQHLQRAWNKYGESNFELIIVENLPNINKQELLIVEQKYLDVAKLEPDKCYNKSFIAGAIDFTPEVRAKMSINSKKQFGDLKTNPNVGRICSDETKRKISDANYFLQKIFLSFVGKNKCALEVFVLY